jgi:Tir chaperone protein (CesT) family
MTIDPTLQLLITELGQTMGLGDLTLDADGACAFRFDGRSVVNVQYRADTDALWLYADLGVPASGPKIYADLLRGNLFWRATLGATLSLSGDEPPHVVLALPTAWRGASGIELAKRLETFLNTAEDWQALIADGDDDESPAASNVPTDDASVMMIRA